MGIYPPRVRQDGGVPHRGNSRRTRHATSWAKGGRGGHLDQWDLGSENAGMKVICLFCYTPEYNILVGCSEDTSLIAAHISTLVSKYMAPTSKLN